MIRSARFNPTKRHLTSNIDKPQSDALKVNTSQWIPYTCMLRYNNIYETTACIRLSREKNKKDETYSKVIYFLKGSNCRACFQTK